jgi:hypothetical protein
MHALTTVASGLLMFEASALEIVVVGLKTVSLLTFSVMSLALRLLTFRSAGTFARDWRVSFGVCLPMNIAFNSATLTHQTEH